MATPRKKALPKDTAALEIDLSAFDIDAIDMPVHTPKSSDTPHDTPKPLSKKERDAFDDTLVPSDEIMDDEEPTIKDDFDDDFEDPFDLDDDAPDGEEK